MNLKTLSISGVLGFLAVIIMPLSASAYVEYGAWYSTPAPYSQLYYQPMYAYSYAPVQSSQNTYINYPQQNYSYGYYPQQYSFGYGAPSYSYYPQYSQPVTQNYAQPYGGYQSYGPYSYGYPTGETMPWLGGELCEFPDYNGRALCGSNPNQYIYDHWTGTWY